MAEKRRLFVHVISVLKSNRVFLTSSSAGGDLRDFFFFTVGT